MKHLLRNPFGPLRTVAMLRKFVPNYSGMALRNGGRALIDSMILMVRLVQGRLTHHRVASVATFAFRVGRLVFWQGPRGACIYLKACHVLLMQSVSGMRLPSTFDLGCTVSRTGSGLPRMVDAKSRADILAGNLITLKLWLTLFSFYRVLEFKGKMKISTITDAGVDLSSLMPQAGTFLLTFFAHLPVSHRVMKVFEDIRGAVFLAAVGTAFRSVLRAIPSLIAKSSPIRVAVRIARGDVQLHSTSWPVLAITAARWVRDPLYQDFLMWCSLTGNWALPTFVASMARLITHPPVSNMVGNVCDWLLPDGAVTVLGDQNLGKLSQKVEPAGKIRVFAVVDAFTQWLFKPLHEALFSLLKEIPQDGTFEQRAPLKPVLDEAIRTAQRVASLDLSAATDRLPIRLQVLLLSHLLGDRLAGLWASLLVNRDYSGLRYAVGQPMGALSSWAMLALTHHFIVQWAWYRICISEGRVYTWYPWYAVLGDDIFLMREDMIEEYRNLMKELGVGIALAKSVIGDKITAEFAKAFYVGTTDCSPVSFAELGVARRSATAALELQKRHSSITWQTLLRVLGVGDFAMTRLEKPKSRRVAAWLFIFSFVDGAGKVSETPSAVFTPMWRATWPGHQWVAFMHYVGFLYSQMLVTSYASMVQSLVKAAPSPLSHVWNAPKGVYPVGLLAHLSNLNSDYTNVFYPSGEINMAVAALEQVYPLIERFMVSAQTVAFYDLESLIMSYMEIRSELDRVRVPTHVQHGDEAPDIASEGITALLKAYLVFKRAERFFTYSFSKQARDIS